MAGASVIKTHILFLISPSLQKNKYMIVSLTTKLDDDDDDDDDGIGLYKPPLPTKSDGEDDNNNDDDDDDDDDDDKHVNAMLEILALQNEVNNMKGNDDDDDGDDISNFISNLQETIKNNDHDSTDDTNNDKDNLVPEPSQQMGNAIIQVDPGGVFVGVDHVVVHNEAEMQVSLEWTTRKQAVTEVSLMQLAARASKKKNHENRLKTIKKKSMKQETTRYKELLRAYSYWNSIRHNLSMNQNFVKVQRPDGFQTKKGFFWAINPDRQHLLDIEIERALKTMEDDDDDMCAVGEPGYMKDDDDDIFAVEVDGEPGSMKDDDETYCC
ncbi:skeletal aspartic acid-rich protein 2-like [Gigantopelta aegis]|uniref:skeletal aspartic acid-rich protein 2-like n=1 Tax=Gigantopelta aegis TaxID=1735272 RepID=UPI001B8892E3|nr:skeletal aspartic acid-rich protein 2-like [Gigantopelta aegis]